MKLRLQFKALRSFLVFHLVVLSAWSLIAEDFHFVGFHNQPDRNKSYWCLDRVMVEKPLKSRNDYESVRRAFKEEHKKQDPSTHLLTPERAAVVYAYTKRNRAFDCEVRVCSIAFGGDLDEAKASMKQKLAEQAKELTSEPEVLFSWQGDGRYVQTFTRQYGDLQITYRTLRADDGRTRVLIRAYNRSPDQAAWFRVKPDGRPEEPPVLIEPGSVLTHTVMVSSTGFLVAIAFVTPPAAKAQPVSDVILNQIKNWIRDQVTTKDGKMKPSPGAAIAVRG